MDASNIIVLASSFLAIVGVFIGAKWQYSKSKVAQLMKLLDLILEAPEDDKVTEEEFQGIVSAAKSLTDLGSGK